MDLITLEELLSDYLPGGFQIEKSKKGEIIIYTGLRQDEDGELVDLKGDIDSEEDSDFPEDDNFEPFDEDEPDDDE